MTNISPWFLVFSNFVYWVPIAVLVYKSRGNKTHFIQEISLFLLIWIASSAHHACDTPEINYCYRSKGVMYAFDLYFSYVAITGAFSAFYAGDIAKIYLSYVFIGPLIIVYLFNDSYTGAIILVAVTTICFIASQLRYALQHVSQFISYVSAVILIAMAIGSKLRGDAHSDDPQTYIIFHSCWHMFSAVAAAVLITGVPHIDVLVRTDLDSVLKRQSESVQIKYNKVVDSSDFALENLDPRRELV